MKVNWNFSRPNPNADTLVLFLHGMNCSPQTVSALTDRIQSVLPNAELLIPNMTLRWHRRLDLRDLSREITEYLAGILRQRNFKSVILMGHSAGGVLVQSVYLDMADAMKPVPLDTAGVRLVLIAPLTRGWSISHHLPLLHKIAWLVGLQCARLIQGWEWIASRVLRRKEWPIWIMQLQRGSPFSVGLRLRWLQNNGKRPLIYVLLGSIDEIVSWRDMVDEVLDDGSVRYGEVPFSNHAEIVHIEDKQYGTKRADLILAALTEDPKQTSSNWSFAPWDTPPPKPELDVERVVFVMHGIRDEGHWTQKIAARARKHFQPEKPGGRIEVETSSYGYFSMRDFLSPRARECKIHWLMDEYVEAKRRYPKAKFSYIGHSNGTYLVAQALEDYPEVEFERIAFAGSVVATRFRWWPFIAKRRVANVLNFTATADWVVSFFPRMAQIFPPLGCLLGRNLGGAGVVPFERAKRIKPRKRVETPAAVAEDQKEKNEKWEGIENNTHVDGGHGEAIKEWNWDHLARFAVAPGAPTPPEFPNDTDHYAERTRWYLGNRFGNLATPAVLLAGLALLTAIACLAWINPILFWVVPGTFLAFGTFLASLCVDRSEGKTFSERGTRLRWAKGCLITFGCLAAAWLIVPGIFLLGSALYGCLPAIKPVLVWGIPAVLLAVGILDASSMVNRSEGKTSTERKAHLRSAIVRITIFGLVAPIIWVCVSSSELPLLRCWLDLNPWTQFCPTCVKAPLSWILEWLNHHQQVLGATRAISFWGFVRALRYVLTKV